MNERCQRIYFDEGKKGKKNKQEQADSPQFGSQPLHAAVVHHCVFFKEGKLLIV